MVTPIYSGQFFQFYVIFCLTVLSLSYYKSCITRKVIFFLVFDVIQFQRWNWSMFLKWITHLRISLILAVKYVFEGPLFSKDTSKMMCRRTEYLLIFLFLFSIYLLHLSNLNFIIRSRREVIDDDGWLYTGDIGLWLPGGRLKIIDRYVVLNSGYLLSIDLISIHLWYQIVV